MNLSQEPVIREKPIVEFARRMRVDGLEKFDRCTVVSVVNFYLDQEHIDKDEASGALVVYIPADYMAKLMKHLGYESIDDDDEQELCDACGTVANLIAGSFIQDLAYSGYVQLQMMNFQSFINSPLDGIGFYPQEEVKHEIDLFLGGEKRIVLELTMSPLRKVL